MSDDRMMELVQTRIEQARESLREAQILAEAHGWRGAINRAYYAMFYAALALLATRDLGTSKHSGALGLFDREFVKPGTFSKDLSRTLHQAFTLRTKSDYEETALVEDATVRKMVAEANDFVESVAAYLRKQGYLRESP